MKNPLNKWRNLSAGVKASIAFFLSRVVTSGIAYLTTPIYTRMLTTEEYGQVSVYFTWVQLIGIVAMFCLSYGVFNNGMIDYKDDRNSFAFSMLILSNVITLICAAVMFTIYFVTNAIGMEWPLLVLMFIAFLLEPAYSFWAARQRFEYKYKGLSVVTIASAILSPLCAVICILLFNDSRLYARIFGAQIILLVIYAIFYIDLIRKNKFKVNVKYWKFALLFNLPLIPHYLSTYLLGSMDKLMISAIISDSAAGFYSVAYSVASVVTIIWSAANSSLVPYTYEKCEKEDFKSVSKVALPILAVFAATCFVLILLAPEVIAVMATKDYKEAIYVIPPIVGGVFFQVQYYLYSNILYYFKKSKFVMIGSITATALNAVLNYFCIKKFGYIAAGYTTLICYLVQAAIDYVAMRIFLGNSVYNMKIVGLLSLLIIVVSVFSNLTYDFYIIRYCVLAVIIILAIIFRRKILSIFRFKNGSTEMTVENSATQGAQAEQSFQHDCGQDCAENIDELVNLNSLDNADDLDNGKNSNNLESSEI